MSIEEIKAAIENGAKFNGTVYSKYNGQWATMFIYLDGKFTKISEVQKSSAASKKAEYEAVLSNATTASTENQNTWLVNEKTVKNNLTYAEMYERYGMDFE